MYICKEGYLSSKKYHIEERRLYVNWDLLHPNLTCPGEYVSKKSCFSFSFYVIIVLHFSRMSPV